MKLDKKEQKENKLISKKQQTKILPTKTKQKSKGFFSKLFSGLFKQEENKKQEPVTLRNPEVEKARKQIIKKLKEKKKIIKTTTKPQTHWKKGDGAYIDINVKGFDALFEKGSGIPYGASVLIEGGPGSGKTIFCLSSVNELCKKGKKCLYMSFEEPEDKLIKHMEEFKWDASEYKKKGLLRVTRFDALDVSRSIEALLSAAKKELLIDVEPMFFPSDFKPDFVVIDSLTSIASAFSGEENRFRIYMEQLFRYLESNGITNFLIREVSSPSHIGTTFTEQGEAVSFLSDGIMVIYNIIHGSGKRSRAMEILKMRGSSFKKRIVEMEIKEKKGVIIYPNKIVKRKKELQFT